MAQMVKNPPAVRKTWVRSLGWEDPLEEGMAAHSRILAWRIPMDRSALQATELGRTERLSTRDQTVKVKSLSRVRLFATPQTVAYQASLSMGFSRQ